MNVLQLFEPVSNETASMLLRTVTGQTNSTFQGIAEAPAREEVVVAMMPKARRVETKPMLENVVEDVFFCPTCGKNFLSRWKVVRQSKYLNV